MYLKIIDQIIDDYEKRQTNGNTILLDRKTHRLFVNELLEFISKQYCIVTEVEERNKIDVMKKDIHLMTYRGYLIEITEMYSLFTIAIISR